VLRMIAGRKKVAVLEATGQCKFLPIAEVGTVVCFAAIDAALGSELLPRSSVQSHLTAAGIARLSSRLRDRCLESKSQKPPSRLSARSAGWPLG
jgi:hypothetical protein